MNRNSIEEKQSEINQLIADNKLLQQKIQSLNKDYNQTVSLLEKALKDFEESQISLSKNEKIYKIVDELQRENAVLKEDCETFSLKFSDMNQESEGLRENIARLRDESDKLSVNCENLRNELSRLGEENLELREEIARGRDSKEKLQISLEERDGKIRKLEEVMEVLQNESSKFNGKDDASFNSATKRFPISKGSFDSHSTVTFEHSEREEIHTESKVKRDFF